MVVEIKKRPVIPGAKETRAAAAAARDEEDQTAS